MKHCTVNLTMLRKRTQTRKDKTSGQKRPRKMDTDENPAKRRKKGSPKSDISFDQKQTKSGKNKMSRRKKKQKDHCSKEEWSNLRHIFKKFNMVMVLECGRQVRENSKRPECTSWYSLTRFTASLTRSAASFATSLSPFIASLTRSAASLTRSAASFATSLTGSTAISLDRSTASYLTRPPFFFSFFFSFL